MHVFVMITIMPFIITYDALSSKLQREKKHNALWNLLIIDNDSSLKKDMKNRKKVGLEHWMIDILWESSLISAYEIQNKSTLSKANFFIPIINLLQYRNTKYLFWLSLDKTSISATMYDFHINRYKTICILNILNFNLSCLNHFNQIKTELYHAIKVYNR